MKSVWMTFAVAAAATACAWALIVAPPPTLDMAQAMAHAPEVLANALRRE